MILTLRREASSDAGVIGMLDVNGRRFPTLERPPAAADKHDACLPAGTYRLLSMTRASGERCFALASASLNVYMLPSEVPPTRVTDARSAVFLAAGFTLDDLIGGHIAPGKERAKSNGMWTLKGTRDAMNEIRTLVGTRFDLTLIIEDAT